MVDDAAVQVGFLDSIAETLNTTKKKPEAALTSLLSGRDDVHQLCSNFRVHHCGVFLACRDASSMLAKSEADGFSILQRFPSAIVAESLSKEYDRPIGIEIVKMERGNCKLELFLLQNGLSMGELAHESSTRSHLALMPRTTDTQALSAFIDIMVS